MEGCCPCLPPFLYSRPTLAQSSLRLLADGSATPPMQDCNIGACIVRIEFWGSYTVVTVRSTQNSIGNHLGPILYPTLL